MVVLIIVGALVLVGALALVLWLLATQGGRAETNSTAIPGARYCRAFAELGLETHIERTEPRA